MKKTGLIIAFVISLAQLQAQQMISYSQYMLNPYSINPAVAGSLSYNPVTLSYKQLWTGIDDAPSYQSMNYHFAAGEKIGIGAKLFNYTAGPSGKLGVEASYAYHLNISSDIKLSFGISGLLYQYSLDKSKFILDDPDDNTILNTSNKLIVPDASFGAYTYSSNWFAGVSVLQMMNRKIDLMNTDSLDLRQVRHFNIMAGYKYDLNDKLSIEPSFMYKFIQEGMKQLDVNIKITLKNLIWIGTSYRGKDAMVAMIGISKDKLAFGYAYDIIQSDIKNYCNGSHELMFIYKLNFKDTPKPISEPAGEPIAEPAKSE